MKIDNFESLAKDLAPIIKQFVSAQVDSLRKEFADGLSQAQAQIKADLEVFKDSFTVPVDGKDGVDGNSVEIEDIEPVLKLMVDEAFSAISVPKDGIDGKDGVDGKSVELQDVEPVLKAMVDEAIASIPMPKDGVDGKDGKDGTDGINGVDGKSVTVEDISPIVEELTGESEKKLYDLFSDFNKEAVTFNNYLEGKLEKAIEAIPVPVDGKDGADGKDGKSVDEDQIASMLKGLVDDLPRPENGRDALDIEILSDIDETKSYPRGSYAAHNGGLWKSFQKTNGMRGWECIVNGVSEVCVEQPGERKSLIRIDLSDGKSVSKELDIPAMVYKGVFKDGNEYEVGDVTTWSGCAWHCNKQTKAKPGTSDEWTLFVKRGRDYKEPVKMTPIDKNAPVKIK